MNEEKDSEQEWTRFEDRFPEIAPLTEEAARARAAQAEHALKRLKILQEEDHENIVHRRKRQETL